MKLLTKTTIILIIAIVLILLFRHFNLEDKYPNPITEDNIEAMDDEVEYFKLTENTCMINTDNGLIGYYKNAKPLDEYDTLLKEYNKIEHGVFKAHFRNGVFIIKDEYNRLIGEWENTVNDIEDIYKNEEILVYIY